MHAAMRVSFRYFLGALFVNTFLFYSIVRLLHLLKSFMHPSPYGSLLVLQQRQYIDGRGFRTWRYILRGRSPPSLQSHVSSSSTASCRVPPQGIYLTKTFWWHCMQSLLVMNSSMNTTVARFATPISILHRSGCVSFDAIALVPVPERNARLFAHYRNNALRNHFDRHTTHALLKELPLAKRPICAEVQQERHVAPGALQKL